MTTITVNTPVQVLEPRGARWAANAATWLAEAIGNRVHAHQLSQRLRTRTEEASEVRRLADSMVAMDPRFAADLYAAADRHERD